MEKLTVVKIGGNIIDNEAALKQFVADFSSIQGHKILVHGGGKLATELSAKLGIETQMVDGRRITDAETVKVVTMTYAGWVNKTIVAQLQAKGCNAFYANVQLQNVGLFQKLGWFALGEVNVHGVGHMFMQANLELYPLTHDPGRGLVHLFNQPVRESISQRHL